MGTSMILRPSLDAPKMRIAERIEVAEIIGCVLEAAIFGTN
jgi:hypothetical protein